MRTFCGKSWSDNDIEHIRALISGSPAAKRSELARKVCELFDWRRADGQLKDMSCRIAMLKMYREGLIDLPAPQFIHRKPRRDFASAASDPEPMLEAQIKDLTDLRLEPVARGKLSTLWNEYIARYHYLGYRITPGAQQRYFIMAGERVLGAMAFGGAAWKVAPRDNFIGWNAERRQSHLHLVVNQTRFLILPWVRIPNLATKSLAMAARRLPGDWQTRYGYCPVLLETFVDTTRFQGTCYRAGNWLNVGLTKGRSRMDRYHANDQPVKSIWLMPLGRNFRVTLLGERPASRG